jgi:ethanolamine-phosphate cytidylyltransferase
LRRLKRETVREIQEKVRLVVNKKRYNDFLNPYNEPKSGDVIGLIMGCWDMLHPGHIALMEQARKNCDYLVVGIYDDETVCKIKGPGFPILNLQERTLSLMALRLVDDVMIGCGRKISSLVVNTVNAKVVFDASFIDTGKEDLGDEAFDELISKGMFKKLDYSGIMTTDVLFERVAKNQEQIAECQRRKAEKEDNYYKNLNFQIKET